MRPREVQSRTQTLDFSHRTYSPSRGSCSSSPASNPQIGLCGDEIFENENGLYRWLSKVGSISDRRRPTGQGELPIRLERLLASREYRSEERRVGKDCVY